MSEGGGKVRYVRLNDGTLIDVESGKQSVDTEINRAFSDQPERSLLRQSRAKTSYGPGKRRYLDDLPLPPEQSRGVAAVVAFHIFGLSNADIAHIAKVKIEYIDNILQSDAAIRMTEAILQNVREHDRDVVRKRINEAATAASDKLVELVASVDEKVALSAAKDVLDRSRSDDVDAGKRLSGGGLTIRIIDERDSPSAKVDVNFEE